MATDDGRAQATHRAADTMLAARQGAQSLRTAAHSGGLLLDPAVGDTYLKAIADAKHQLKDMDRQISYMKMAAKLGSSPAAQVTIPFNQLIADGDAQSFAPNIKLAMQVLDEFEHVVHESVKAYQRVDEDARRGIDRAGGA